MTCSFLSKRSPTCKSSSNLNSHSEITNARLGKDVKVLMQRQRQPDSGDSEAETVRRIGPWSLLRARHGLCRILQVEGQVRGYQCFDDEATLGTLGTRGRDQAPQENVCREAPRG